MLKGSRTAGFGVTNALINSSQSRLIFVIRDRRLLFQFKFLSFGHFLMLAPISGPRKRTRG